MKIIAVSNTNIQTKYSTECAKSKALCVNQQNKSNKPYIQADIPASVYKSNFLPSFGKFKKVKNVTILNRDTGKTVQASLQKETIGDFLRYRLLVNREEVGYMNMNCDIVFPETDFLLNEPDNNIPQVTHLRSIAGDKYAGIGTALLDVAVDESKKRGKMGALWLYADKGYAHSVASYRKNESPLPFYYKLGFESLDKNLNAQIQEGLITSNYGILPSSTILVLPSDKADALKHYYATHYTYDLE